MKRLTKVRSFLILMLICTILLGLAPAGTPKAAEQSSEVVSLREENVKHFKVGENSYEAIAYSHPVHEKDENGVWQDIDFGMSYTKTRGLATYQNKTAGVEFSATYTKNQPLMSIANDDVSISMTPIAAPFTSGKAVNEQVVSTSAAKVTNPKSKFLTIEDAESATFSSTLLYENILENVDLEYTVSYSSVKENIIVKKPANEYTYYFTLVLDKLYPKMHSDGAVLLYHSTSNELKYVIPAPFMYDNKGNLSESVKYTIENVGENKYQLAISADASWINEDVRSFPITIDPTVNEVSELILDTYVNSDTPDRNYGYSQHLWVRHNRISLLKFTPLSLPDYAKLKEATLYMFYFYYDYV